MSHEHRWRALGKEKICEVCGTIMLTDVRAALRARGIPEEYIEPVVEAFEEADKQEPRSI